MSCSVGFRWLRAFPFTAVFIAAFLLVPAPIPLSVGSAGAQTSRPAPPTLGADLAVRQIELSNGLGVILLPRSGAPTVSFVMTFGVGGVHEHLGATGVAHVLEHMLFKGTQTIGTTDVEAERLLFARADSVHDLLLEARVAGDTARMDELGARLSAIEDEAREYVVSNEFDRIFTRAGAQGLNATTTNDATTYFVELPSNRVELFFAMEADRMANAVFREFYSERDVVMEERRMRVDASPAGALYEAHLAAAYDVHPYGVPVVGWMSDLETLRREDVERYYRDFYGPNNAVLAVVGGFDVDEVERWARHYLGGIPRGSEPPIVTADEPRQRGERRVEIVWDAEPQLRVGWHVPSARHADAPALSVLSSVLTGGRSSRLHRRLVTEEQIATAVYSSMGPGGLYPRLFQLDATPIHPATTEQLEAAVYEEIARLVAEGGPSSDEIDRVRNQVAAGEIRRVESNLGLAFQLAGAASMYGDWREAFGPAQRIGSVTREDVRRVAEEYLQRQNRTVATLVRAGDGR